MGILSIGEQRGAFGVSGPDGGHVGFGSGLGAHDEGHAQRRPHISDQRYADAGLITAWAGGNFNPAEASRDVVSRGGKAHIAPSAAFGSRGYSHLGGTE